MSCPGMLFLLRACALGRRDMALRGSWIRLLGRGLGKRLQPEGIPASVRAASGISRDMLPGPYPRTMEEREKAAKKYNMRVEDYEPYPDDGMGFGDYPKLLNRSQQERDPWYTWDEPDLRRNWGEPMHWDFDMFIRNRVDTSPSPVDWSTMVKTLGGFVGLMLFMFFVGEVFPSYQPVAPKQYPYNNLYLEHGGEPNEEQPEVHNYKI